MSALPAATAGPPPDGRRLGEGTRSRAEGRATRALTYAIARAFGTVVVTLHGEFDSAGAATVEALLVDLIDGQGNLAVVLDVRDVVPVDGGAVGVLARAARSARLRGGQLSVHRPPDALADELDSAGLRALIDESPPSPHRDATALRPVQPDRSAKE